MIVIVEGRYRPQINRNQPELNAALFDDLSFERLRLAGQIYDDNGQNIGFTAVLDVENVGDAETYLTSSAYPRAGLYETTRLVEFRPEVGHLG